MSFLRLYPTLAVLLVLGTAARAQDLPYDSGSTGADGPFAPDLAPAYTPRYMASGAFDAARGEIVLVNGAVINNFGSTTALGIAFRTDSWTWDGTAWAAKGANVLTSVQDAAAAYDPVSQRVVLYGGRNSGGSYLSSGAVWDGTAWTTTAHSAPGNRGHHVMFYDPLQQKVLLHGGWSGTVALATLFAWDSTSSTWTNLNPTNPPPARYYHALCWDDLRQEAVLFGGYSGGPLNETWVYSHNTWTQKFPASSPPARYSHQMGFDPQSGRVVCHGGWSGVSTLPQMLGDTWLWDGTNWTEAATTRALTARVDAALVTDTARNELLLVGGRDREFGARNDTWRWDGVATNWVQISGSPFVVDLAAKPDGVFHHTSIQVPTGLTVEFVANSNNTPVVWLATDDVTIDGVVSVNGRTGFLRDNHAGENAPGGPGGYPGGLGGYRNEFYNTLSGTPGGGPAGGAPGITFNQVGGAGRYQGLYGNVYVIPLLGGSGGGGGASTSVSLVKGGNGGGGGGCILIASSRDIAVNGSVQANGGYLGNNVSTTGTQGGHGSGGAVKLVADRILGSGQIQARSGNGTTTSNQGGYVRLESFLRPFDISGTVSAGTRSNAAPVPGVNYGPPPRLAITQVDGAGVTQPPSGAFDSPDVIFADAGAVDITVTGTNLPDGSPVLVTVYHSAGTIALPAQNLSGGVASFSATIPAGFGTIVASATYNVTP